MTYNVSKQISVYRPLRPVYTRFLDWSISRDSEGHVESVQPIKCMIFISSPSQRQCELLPLGVHRLLTFHILIFSSETAKPIDLKFRVRH